MKISHKWLMEFLDLDPSWTPERVAQTLTDLGIEVESVEYIQKRAASEE